MRKETSTNFQNERHLLSECPFNRTLDALGGRWRPAVLWKILGGARRFGALTRAIPPITEKMLAQELRELEARGMVCRVVVSERPLHVEYAPTPLGASLEPVLRQMYEWGEGGRTPEHAAPGGTMRGMDAYELAVRVGEEAGVKLEIAGGIPTWEAFPSYRHQTHVFRIQSSIRRTEGVDTDCGCVHASDVYVRFPDGSLKRPDIAIFCGEPTEQTEAITIIPEAVVEIVSPGYEAKDLSIGVPFYLRSGLKDVIVFDPETNGVRHFRPGHSEAQYTSPVTIALACGCQVTV